MKNGDFAWEVLQKRQVGVPGAPNLAHTAVKARTSELSSARFMLEPVLTVKTQGF